ncbi:hypothetical protein ACJMK2_004457 [Sinanodonta woodiana]|uniref:glucuronosyl-galactosyl-proteoglycan 4-alpha-N-acetylglucosaminyltransferase n=1 Tax=Sinanodonta woodiana TaxID=1069815 RepID=A0ABD3Y3C4_SINWO
MECKMPPGRNRMMNRLARNHFWPIIGCLLLLLIVLSLLCHYYISDVSSFSSVGPVHRSRSKLDHSDDLDHLKSSDLKGQIEELRAIKASVNNELRQLEGKRQQLQVEISKFHIQAESFREEQDSMEKELKQTKLSLEQLKMEQEEIANRFMPVLKAPEKILSSGTITDTLSPPKFSSLCRMHSCFDYSRCSLLSGFPVFVYDTSNYLSSLLIDKFIKESVTSAFRSNPYVTTDPLEACVFVVILGENTAGLNDKDLEQLLTNLPHWNGDGRNHILVNLARTENNFDMFGGVGTGRAIIAQSSFVETVFREKFDIVLPPSFSRSDGDSWDELSPLSPIRRKYFASFIGQFWSADSKVLDMNTNLNLPSETFQGSQLANGAKELINLETIVVQNLKHMKFTSKDNVFLQFVCDNNLALGFKGEWGLCADKNKRFDILKQSTFALIISPANVSIISTTIFQSRLYESLKNGAIPVVIGDYMELPFSEILDWRRAVIALPKPRITELHFFLRTLSDNNVAEYKRHGRMMWEAYFGTSKKIIITLLSVLRTRLQIPPIPIADEPSPSVFNTSFVPLTFEPASLGQETDELLGPVEAPFASIKFRENFTNYIHLENYNHPGDPFHLYPFTPFEKVLPSEAKFLGSGYGFRPINRGEGGSGKEFSESLGGDLPREQFTVVMLTYEREAVMISAVQRLKGLPYLNKVIVVWNNPNPPSADLRWPNIRVPVHVIKVAKNSLNNRFLPFDAIETEAILSIDDDAHLRHDEIVFGFRVWREERDRIVGFPGRFHAWDLKNKSWLYNSNYSCELSMVLTGAAFFHKYYAYLYSYVMPQAIRNKVDEYMNCEDIAMNFLVSHITRKPPVKVTSRWTFRCPGCPQTLSNDSSHFDERHHCINFFVTVYGYMPLLYTQFRVDSVLFKTRIPHDKQKCFKFI